MYIYESMIRLLCRYLVVLRVHLKVVLWSWHRLSFRGLGLGALGSWGEVSSLVAFVLYTGRGS